MVASDQTGRAQHPILQFKVDVVQQLEAVHAGEVAGGIAARDVVKLGLDVCINHLLEGEAQELRVLEVAHVAE